MGYQTDLTDAQWALIESTIPEQERRGRPRTVDLRRVVDALMYQDRTGCQWRLIPRDFRSQERFVADKVGTYAHICRSAWHSLWYDTR